MRQISLPVGRVIAAFALFATAAPAYSQSNHAPVADDGSGVEAVFSGEARGNSTAPSSGARRITEAALAKEGVLFDDESASRFRRLVELPDGGTRSSSEGAAEVIIGWDTRERLYTRTYPARAKVLITFSAGRCSGVMIGPNTVATAGHCVHSGGTAGAWYPRANYRIYPGRDGTASPYGVCTAKSLHSVVGWTTNGSEEYDYAAIKLNCTVGNTVGWFGFAATTPTNVPTILGGYPGDKPLEQWSSSDRVRALSARQAFYSNDTMGGHSGSGVWHDPNGPYIIAIHAYGTHGSGNHALYNHGTLVNTAVANNLLAWKNLP